MTRRADERRAAQEALTRTRSLLHLVADELDRKLERYRQEAEEDPSLAPITEELERTWDSWFQGGEEPK